MRLTDRAIQVFAEDLGMVPSDLRNQLDNLDEQFRQSYGQNDWMGCLDVVKRQNRLLKLCPNEPESDQSDWLENVG
jgi:hypothetical protein